MTYISKVVMLEEAKRLGMIDQIKDLPWHLQQKQVQARLVEEGCTIDTEGLHRPGKVKKSDKMQQAMQIEVEELVQLRKEVNELKAAIQQQKKKSMPNPTEPFKSVDTDGDTTKINLQFRPLYIDPEIRGERYQPVKYDEVLGADVDIEEVDMRDKLGSTDFVTDRAVSGTYRVRKGNGKKVIAQSTIPKINAGIIYDPNVDIVPRVYHGGHEGYLYDHHIFPCIKGLLMQSGQFYKYKNLFNSAEHPENVWYAAGKLLVCDKGVADYVLREIENDAKR